MKTYRYHLTEPLNDLVFTIDEDQLIALTLEPISLESEIKDKSGDKVYQQIVDYFQGRLKVFTLAYSLEGYTQFQQDVLNELTKVAYGDTISYQQLAIKAGYPKAARAVGSVMAMNPLPLLIPCHRVIRADQSLGAYSMGGQAMKEKLLAMEANYA